MLADRGTCAEVRHTLAVVCRAPGAHLELPLSAAERRRAQNQGLTVAYSGAHLVFGCCLNLTLATSGKSVLCGDRPPGQVLSQWWDIRRERVVYYTTVDTPAEAAWLCLTCLRHAHSLEAASFGVTSCQPKPTLHPSDKCQRSSVVKIHSLQ